MSRWALETRSDFLDEDASSRWEMSASRFERQRLGVWVSGLLAMFFEVIWGGGPGGGGMWLDIVIWGLPDRFGFFFGFLVAGV